MYIYYILLTARVAQLAKVTDTQAIIRELKPHPDNSNSS